ncbi:MAG: hypothetical protein AAF798_07015 [Bacteroidota bacterium]
MMKGLILLLFGMLLGILLFSSYKQANSTKEELANVQARLDTTEQQLYQSEQQRNKLVICIDSLKLSIQLLEQELLKANQQAAQDAITIDSLSRLTEYQRIHFESYRKELYKDYQDRLKENGRKLKDFYQGKKQRRDQKLNAPRSTSYHQFASQKKTAKTLNDKKKISVHDVWKVMLFISSTTVIGAAIVSRFYKPKSFRL